MYFGGISAKIDERTSPGMSHAGSRRCHTAPLSRNRFQIRITQIKDKRRAAENAEIAKLLTADDVDYADFFTEGNGENKDSKRQRR